MSNFEFTRPNTFPPVVKNLIIVNVLIYIAQITIGRQFGLTERMMLYPVDSPLFNPYQIITHLFAHSPDMYVHIIFNMWALYMFGKQLENRWGSKRFLTFYMICGIGAALVHLSIQYIFRDRIPQAEALGASGAVMGLVAAFGYLFSESRLVFFPIPIPIKAKWAVLILVAYDLYGGLTNSDNVAHFAHLGGALTGFILVFFWYRKDRHNFY